MSSSSTNSSESDRELLEMLYDWDNEDAEIVQRITKTYKPRINYMVELDNFDFLYRFRISKSVASVLLVEIQPFLKTTSTRNHGIPPLHQLLLTLRFYALGTMLVSVADFVGVSISSASRIVSNVSAAIARLYPRYIVMERHTQQEFYNIAGFPKVHGAVDGTHIPIQSPNLNIGEEFRNRKGFFSLNVQGVCNAHLMFLNVVARWPGSTHDATIFNNSELRAQCEGGLLENRWLLGDSAYPCKPYLLTPLLNPITDAEQQYNEAHIKTRNSIDRCFGVWKRRFPVLSLKMRLALPNTQAVIIATAVLHNICRECSVDDIEPEVDVLPEVNDAAPSLSGTVAVNQANNERQSLIDNYFSRQYTLMKFIFIIIIKYFYCSVIVINFFM